MSKLLIDEHPLEVLPGLAVKIGLNEAIFIQQLHYWLIDSKHNFDGRKWVYNTFEEWNKQLPFWSIITIKRAVASLRDAGLILTSSEYNKMGADRTLWYTIDYEALDRLDMIQPSYQIDTPKVSRRSAPKSRNDTSNNQRLLPETTTETNNSTRVDHTDQQHHSTRAQNAQPDDVDRPNKSMPAVGLAANESTDDHPSDRDFQPPIRAPSENNLSAADAGPPDHLTLCPEPNLRQAAWELGLALFGDEWAGYGDFVGKQPIATVIRLLEWIARYSDLDVERQENIESMTRVVRAHLKRDERAELRRWQRNKLIATVMAVES